MITKASLIRRPGRPGLPTFCLSGTRRGQSKSRPSETKDKKQGLVISDQWLVIRIKLY